MTKSWITISGCRLRETSKNTNRNKFFFFLFILSYFRHFTCTIPANNHSYELRWLWPAQKPCIIFRCLEFVSSTKNQIHRRNTPNFPRSFALPHYSLCFGKIGFVFRIWLDLHSLIRAFSIAITERKGKTECEPNLPNWTQIYTNVKPARKLCQDLINSTLIVISGVWLERLSGIFFISFASIKNEIFVA